MVLIDILETSVIEEITGALDEFNEKRYKYPLVRD